MNELNIRIQNAINHKAAKYGLMGTESIDVSLILTDEEIQQFKAMEFDDHYDWEFEGNKLFISWVEDLEKETIGNKQLSLDNGIHFLDASDFNIYEEKIVKLWDEIVNIMDNEDMEKTNDIIGESTDTNEGKLQYIKDYLSIAKYDIVIG